MSFENEINTLFQAGLKLFNEKNFSGAIMGMGLSKSYQQGSKKICIYNTINGQDKLVFKNNKVECPVEYPKRKKK